MSGPIDLITAAPDEDNPATIATEIDLFVRQVKAAIPQVNAVVNAFNFNATNSTSTDSLTISVGVKTLNFGVGKSYQKGMALTLAYSTDPSQWMRGEVLTYDSGTGAGTFNCRTISSTTGTYAAWTISQAAVEAVLNYSALILYGGNGHGSTNNKVRRLSTTLLNAGTAHTYADSATLGMSATINENGLYQGFFGDNYSGGLCNSGISKNSSQLTTSIQSIAIADIMGYDTFTASNDIGIKVTPLTKCVVGDVLRMHGGGNADSAGNACYFGLIKVQSL